MCGSDFQLWNNKLDEQYELLMQLKADTEKQEEMGYLPQGLKEYQVREDADDFDAQLREKLQAQFYGSSDTVRQKGQAEDEKELWQIISEGEQNFFDGSEWINESSELFRANVEGLYKGLEADARKLDRMGLLRLIYSRTYDLIVGSDRSFSALGRNMPIYKSVFEACVFMAICMFLHNSKRLKRTTLSQFIYSHSHLGYDDAESIYYIPHKGTWKQGEMTPDLSSDEAKLRQYRHRLFKQRSVDNRRPEWSAMPETSEYEWQLYFDIVDNVEEKTDAAVRDTLKRIRNLNKDVIQAIESPMDDGYGKRLEIAWSTFLSKLQKIKYKNYLALCKAFLKHIAEKQTGTVTEQDDATDYGINLYRFEKELRFFELANDVKRLLACEDESEMERILIESCALNNICFPHVRKEVSLNRPIDDVTFLTEKFQLLGDCFIRLSRLLVDRCQRQYKIVRKRRRKIVDFRRCGVTRIRCCLAEKEC